MGYMGTTIGVTKGDTRSLDHGSNPILQIINPKPSILSVTSLALEVVQRSFPSHPPLHRKGEP